jgi:integrase
VVAASLPTAEKSALVQSAVAAVAPRTLGAYLSAYGAFSTWCEGVYSKPGAYASPVQVAQFLSKKAREGVAGSTIQMYLAALKWAAKVMGKPDWTDATLIKLVTPGLMRTVARPKKRKVPLSLSQVEKICATHAGENSNLARLRRRAIILLGFAGFCRADEIISIQNTDVKFSKGDGHVEINITKSKCDQLREGRQVVIASNKGKQACPVHVLKELMGHMGNAQQGPLIQGIKLSRGERVFNDRSVSYNLVREVVKRAIKAIGEDPSRFSTHSMRAGGASAAAAARVDPRMLQRHGRWARPESMNIYVKDRLQDKLEVSRAVLGK